MIRVMSDLENALLRRTDRWFALLDDERREEFQRGGTVVASDMNLSSINIECFSRFVSRHGTTFVFKSQRAFQNIA